MARMFQVKCGGQGSKKMATRTGRAAKKQVIFDKTEAGYRSKLFSEWYAASGFECLTNS
jgi:hypothetical protein